MEEEDDEEVDDFISRCFLFHFSLFIRACSIYLIPCNLPFCLSGMAPFNIAGKLAAIALAIF